VGIAHHLLSQLAEFGGNAHPTRILLEFTNNELQRPERIGEKG
jgi:hypothetical protein